MSDQEQDRRLSTQKEQALELNRQRKASAKSKQKASLSPAITTKAAKTKTTAEAKFKRQWEKTAAGLSEEEQRRAVEQAIEVFKQLPPTSQYAKHRLKLLHTALELLNKSRQGWLKAGGAGGGCGMRTCRKLLSSLACSKLLLNPD